MMILRNFGSKKLYTNGAPALRDGDRYPSENFHDKSAVINKKTMLRSRFPCFFYECDIKMSFANVTGLYVTFLLLMLRMWTTFQCSFENTIFSVNETMSTSNRLEFLGPFYKFFKICEIKRFVVCHFVREYWMTRIINW